MEAPQAFTERLKREFPDLRIRWSEKRECWQIEQQVGRGCLPPLRIDPYDDTLIRARDGFSMVCEVRPGDRMPCAGCHTTLSVPIFEFREVTCMRCKLAGKDGRIAAGFFPLGDMLLEHLRSTDPNRGAIERMIKEIDLSNARLEMSQKRDLSNHNENFGKDYFNTMFGIQSVGYTGNRNSKMIHRDKYVG